MTQRVVTAMIVLLLSAMPALAGEADDGPA